MINFRAALSAFGVIVLSQAMPEAGVAQTNDGKQPAIGAAVKDLPIFDAHIHYKEPAWGPYPVDRIVDLMDRSGVAMGLVSSSPDEGTIRLWEFAPNRVVPELPLPLTGLEFENGVHERSWFMIALRRAGVSGIHFPA